MYLFTTLKSFLFKTPKTHAWECLANKKVYTDLVQKVKPNNTTTNILIVSRLTFVYLYKKFLIKLVKLATKAQKAWFPCPQV